MIVYGANFQWYEPYDDDDKVALMELLGTQGHEALKNDPMFKALKRELNQVFRFIVKHHAPTQGQKGYKNAVGQTLKRTDNPKRSQVAAFVLQGVETQAAIAMVEASKTPLVLIHDGIVTAEPEHIPKLENAMLESTGIEFTLQHEVIEKPAFLP